jgi:hypothetical protein
MVVMSPEHRAAGRRRNRDRLEVCDSPSRSQEAAGARSSPSHEKIGTHHDLAGERRWSGDPELVEGIRNHLHDVDLRASGTTTTIRGDVEVP